MAVRLGALGAAAVCMHHPERGGGEGAYLEEGGEGAYLEGRSAYLEGECLPRGERGVRLLTSSGYESSTALTACSDALMNECTHALTTGCRARPPLDAQHPAGQQAREPAAGRTGLHVQGVKLAPVEFGLCLRASATWGLR